MNKTFYEFAKNLIDTMPVDELEKSLREAGFVVTRKPTTGQSPPPSTGTVDAEPLSPDDNFCPNCYRGSVIAPAQLHKHDGITYCNACDPEGSQDSSDGQAHEKTPEQIVARLSREIEHQLNNLDDFSTIDPEILALAEKAIAAVARRATSGNVAAVDLPMHHDPVRVDGYNEGYEACLANIAAAAREALPVFCYTKEVHPGWREYNLIDEFSSGNSGGDPLVKLSDVLAHFTARVATAADGTQAARDNFGALIDTFAKRPDAVNKQALLNAIRMAVEDGAHLNDLPNGAPALTVWEGPMPESNGKSNFTAVLMRKGLAPMDGMVDGFTIARSEYPDRVRYEADCVRYLIGLLKDRPCILDYDAQKHSGYIPPTKAEAPADPVMPETMPEAVDEAIMSIVHNATFTRFSGPGTLYRAIRSALAATPPSPTKPGDQSDKRDRDE
jgi:uncharacterized Zn finger protein (UPF0148 family)